MRDPLLALLSFLFPFAALAAEPIDIGSRRELFVDRHLIEHLENARLVAHRPQPQEVALTLDRPWEAEGPGYVTVFQDGDRYRMYYRALPDGEGPRDERQVTCYAEKPRRYSPEAARIRHCPVPRFDEEQHHSARCHFTQHHSLA